MYIDRSALLRWEEASPREHDYVDTRAYYEATMSIIDDIHRHVRDGSGHKLGDLQRFQLRFSELNIGRLADLGCGSGQWAHFYARQALEVHLIDLSPLLLERARQTVHAIRTTLAVTSRVADLFDQPSKAVTGTFDTYLLAFVLSHASERQISRLLSHVSATCPSGSRVAIIDSCVPSDRLLSVRRDAYRYVCLGGLKVGVRKHYFLPQEIERIATACGYGLTELLWGKRSFMALLST